MASGAQPRLTQAGRKSAAKADLVQATIELIAERGLDDFTVADVGLRAGKSRGLAGHHFGSRESLVQAAVAELFQSPSSSETRGAMGLQPLLKLIGEALEGSLKLKTHLRARFVVVGSVQSGGRHKAEAAQFQAAPQALIRAHIEAGMATNEIDPGLNADQQALVIYAAMRGVVSLALEGHPTLDPVLMKLALIETVRRALAAGLSGEVPGS